MVLWVHLLEKTMSSKKPKNSHNLKVQVSFEASRLSDECLARAYEEVAPELLKRTRKNIQRPCLQSELIREIASICSNFNFDRFC